MIYEEYNIHNNRRWFHLSDKVENDIKFAYKFQITFEQEANSQLLDVKIKSRFLHDLRNIWAHTINLLDQNIRHLGLGPPTNIMIKIIPTNTFLSPKWIPTFHKGSRPRPGFGMT